MTKKQIEVASTSKPIKIIERYENGQYCIFIIYDGSPQVEIVV